VPEVTQRSLGVGQGPETGGWSASGAGIEVRVGAGPQGLARSLRLVLRQLGASKSQDCGSRASGAAAEQTSRVVDHGEEPSGCRVSDLEDQESVLRADQEATEVTRRRPAREASRWPESARSGAGVRGRVRRALQAPRDRVRSAGRPSSVRPRARSAAEACGVAASVPRGGTAVRKPSSPQSVRKRKSRVGETKPWSDPGWLQVHLCWASCRFPDPCRMNLTCGGFVRASSRHRGKSPGSRDERRTRAA
jgi:hypothetical protein